jgi:MFS family permease
MSLPAFLRENSRFLSAGVVLTLASCPGQTFFIALFAAKIMEEFSLTDGGWGAIYTLATTASAAAMLWAGTLTDRFRARSLAWIVMPGLALVCLVMAWNTSLILLIALVFFLRLLGQGMMFQLATVSMARWFSARRGLALSIAALGFSFGQAAFPVLVALLFTVMAWRQVWIVAALLLLAALPLILWLLAAERTPASIAQESPVTGMAGRHWTRGQMLRSPVFWLIVPMLIGPPSWGTALFFQQVHIAEVKNWPLIDYLALIPLLTIVGVATTLVSGQLIDRFGSGPLLRIYLMPWALGFFLMSGTETRAAAAFAFVVFGLATGLQATVITAFWAEYFGTRHIGAIKSVSTSIMVLGSAIGPGISGLFIDLGYPFPSQMLAISGFFLVALGLVWLALVRADRLLGPPQIDV